MSAHTPFLQLHDFLSDDEVRQLLHGVDQHRDRFEASTVYEPEDGVRRSDRARRSRVDLHPDWVRSIFEPRLRALAPHIRRELGMSHFTVGDLEMQVTVHGDGDFFAPHIDEGNPWTDRSRALTFVYYFSEQPPRFSGGELRLFDGIDDDPKAHADEFVEIMPDANSIVFFAPDRWHEVAPVRTSDPNALRCTVNGWFRHVDLGVPPPVALPPSTLRLLAPVLVPRLTDGGAAMLPIPRAHYLELAAAWARVRRSAAAESVDTRFITGGRPDISELGEFGRELQEHLRPLHEEWAGCDLVASGCYGPRTYRRGQSLAMHVADPEHHVIGSTLHIERDIDEPWPLDVQVERDVDGVLSFDPQPGQMVMYEAARCPHGRPRPLLGSTHTSLFLDYRPADWATNLEQLVSTGRDEGLIDDVGRPTDALIASSAPSSIGV